MKKIIVVCFLGLAAWGGYNIYQETREPVTKAYNGARAKAKLLKDTLNK